MKQLKIQNQLTIRDNDALDKYLNDVSRINVISIDEEQALGKRIREEQDELAVDKLVKANLRFVVSVAKQYQSSGLQLTDLINEGNIGLIRAAWKFDETRGFKFISYAVWWIRQAIMSAITYKSRTIKLPMNRMNEIIKLQKATQKFLKTYSRDPSLDELSDMTEMTGEHIAFLNSSYQYSQSLDQPVNEDRNYYDQLADTSLPSPDSGFDKQSLKVEIEKVLVSLKPKEREIIEYAFGLGMYRPLSFSEIAEKYSMTPERARQIKHRALSKLKKHSKQIFA